MDTKLLSLLRVTDTGSYTRAAESLSLTQPAVSQHIRQLETEYGVRLFERSHNRFRLTPKGETMVKYARRIQALYARMEQAMGSDGEELRALTIGITHTAESSAIIEALAAYVQQFDDLTMKIITNTSDKLYAMLKNYELDFAFVEGRYDDDSLSYLMLDTDRLVLVVAPDHALAREVTVTIAQLKKERLILRLPNSNTRNLFTASLESQNLSVGDFNVIMEIDSIATIKDLVRRGFGVSVLARSACLEELRDGELAALTVENLSMMRQINLVCRRDYEYGDLLNGIARQYNAMQRL
jgi:DNA-binding transcriptional LysR family regulator